MIQADDLLQIRGNFESQSSMNHDSSAKIINYPEILENDMSFRISRGVLTGLQDALSIRELSDASAALIATLGITLAASTVIMPMVVVSAIGTIMEVISVISSVHMAAAAVKGIYSTAMGAGNRYDKAEAFAHDATMLAVSLIFLWGTASAIKNSTALFKSASQNLIGRTSRLTPSEVTQTYKGAKLLTSFDDFAEYTKGFLDDDALQYVREVLNNDGDDIAKLKKIAQLIEDGSQKIGRKLSKEELKAGLDALWDDAGVEGALAAIERVFKGNPTVRVGQWMSKSEYESFIETGNIPRTNVLRNGKEGYIKQAEIGDYYVEFDVDETLLMLKNEELGWWLVKSKNRMQLRLAEIKGIILPEPTGKNIIHVFTKTQ